MLLSISHLLQMFVEEVMLLVELNPIRNCLVGLPGVSGLSTEQRKRLTIAVELVANPSIIFMDEPTSGLDARAAAIVMRTVRNTVDTGRTVVCTIHQPSIDIFEAFDEVRTNAQCRFLISFLSELLLVSTILVYLFSSLIIPTKYLEITTVTFNEERRPHYICWTSWSAFS